MKTTIPSFLTIIALASLALLPRARAVVPPPDGGYPGFNTAEGTSALQNLTTGVGNTAAGWHSLFANSVGNLNTAIGAGALLFNTADNNTATGVLALLSNTTGLHNTANGAFALLSNTDGRWNTAIGEGTLSQNTLGDFNTAVGYGALPNDTTGAGNVALGSNAGANVTTADRVICIGHGVGGANISLSTWIGNIYGTTTQSQTLLPVVVSDGGQLGTVASSGRFKKDIALMDKNSEAILSLRPVTFHYKTDTKGTPQFGLIAEEVAKVNPALVVPDKDGKPYTVRYDAVNAMLLNEFLKEHRKNEEQGASIAQLRKDLETTAAQHQKQIEALTVSLQRVSAQLTAANPSDGGLKAAPRTVSNNY